MTTILTGNRCNTRADFLKQKWIRRHIKKDNEWITNPKWENALYEEALVTSEKGYEEFMKAKKDEFIQLIVNTQFSSES
jgi:hypothetical protein